MTARTPSGPARSRPAIRTVYGVDFSGAALAGRNLWVARAEPFGRARPRKLRLLALDPAERLAGGDPSRDAALGWLVAAIRASDAALWGMDFPFGLPVELGWTTWAAQLKAVADWPGSTAAFGVHCCQRALAVGDRLHIRRRTDVETRTPFDCYHYRIIYQTVHGMRDVLRPLRRDRATAVVPFHLGGRLADARRVVAESCPGSTLRRMRLPYNNYKQTKPGRVAAKLRRTRVAILDGLRDLIELDARQLRAVLGNPGGDALDATIAAVGVWHDWQAADLAAVARDDRYRREGRIFA